MFCLQPTWVPELKETEDTYCRHSKRSIVPLYLWGAGVTGESGDRWDVRDLMPALCRILDIPVPYTARDRESLHE